LIGGAVDGGRRAAPAVVAGLLPLVAWETFSVIYYGAPFPNTAYAKLATGLTTRDLLPHGVAYLAQSLTADPVTLVAIAIGIAAGFLARTRREWTLSIGAIAYLTYVVRVGGDFMSGRLLTAPLVVAVGLIAHSRWPRIASTRIAAAVGAVAVLVLTWALPAAPILSGRDYGDAPRHIPASGITDERAYYYGDTGLLLTTRLRPGPRTDEPARVLKHRRAGESVVLRDAVGFFGFYAGPSMHVVDVLGLCDPLLARRPTGPRWRIGHYYREVPAGYLETLRTGTNQIQDPSIAQDYATLASITRDPLWSRTRWEAIWRANLSLGVRP
jgi:arabinofuranosyltransferase